VVQLDLATLNGLRHTLADPKFDPVAVMELQEWSEFREKIGHFFISAGVYGAAEGSLFDLTAQTVEDLAVNSTSEDGYNFLDEEKPLLCLAVCACWVLQTLAHHSEKPEEWIPFCNDIASLVRLGASAPEEPSSEKHITDLLYSLIDVYETLRQNEPSGYISCQLSYKYDKALKKVLKKDWEEQLERLKNNIATHVMALVLYDRYKKHGLKRLMAKSCSQTAAKHGRRAPPQGSESDFEGPARNAQASARRSQSSSAKPSGIIETLSCNDAILEEESKRTPRSRMG